MAKSAKEKGGLFSEVDRLADAAPGPEKYHKDILNRNFVGKTRGGQFSKLGRENTSKIKIVLPAVGSYERDAAIDKTSPRTRGGQVSKMDRKCFFWESALKNDLPAPGKYDAKKTEVHLKSPRFDSPKTESRSPRKPSAMGPGYYNPSFTTVEKTVPVYSGSKRNDKSFLDEIVNKKDQTPAPGHVGIPFSKVEDRRAKQLHSARLLLDRKITPRAIDTAR